MSKRYGKARVPNCTCTYNFTCGACLKAAPTSHFTPSRGMTPRECIVLRDTLVADKKRRDQRTRTALKVVGAVALSACVLAGAGCAAMPDRLRVELSHDSHATTGSASCSRNCSEDGLTRASLILKWQRGPFVIEAGEGWNLKGRNGGGFYGPGEVFTARAGYEFNLKR